MTFNCDSSKENDSENKAIFLREKHKLKKKKKKFSSVLRKEKP